MSEQRNKTGKTPEWTFPPELGYFETGDEYGMRAGVPPSDYNEERDGKRRTRKR